MLKTSIKTICSTLENLKFMKHAKLNLPACDHKKSLQTDLNLTKLLYVAKNNISFIQARELYQIFHKQILFFIFKSVSLDYLYLYDSCDYIVSYQPASVASLSGGGKTT